MTTFIQFDNDTSHQAVTRRIREELARHAIKSDSQAAKLYGRPQQWLQRHMSGESDWKVQELHGFCATLGLDRMYVVFGIRTVPGGGGPGIAAPAIPDYHPSSPTSPKTRMRIIRPKHHADAA